MELDGPERCPATALGVSVSQAAATGLLTACGVNQAYLLTPLHVRDYYTNIYTYRDLRSATLEVWASGEEAIERHRIEDTEHIFASARKTKLQSPVQGDNKIHSGGQREWIPSVNHATQ